MRNWVCERKDGAEMAQRTVCLCDGKYIGIETIYTVINGQQINIPEKLKELRTKSQNNELFCPCGCGSNLILVAGDRNLREQHFRLKDGGLNGKCHAVTEGKVSVASKIVLKCWLDEKLKINDIETRVPINMLGNIDRKYEFSFLSRIKNIALSYCHERVNLLDEKFEILEANSQNIHIIYVIDAENRGGNGQYPEGLMKVQDRQGYCLLLNVENISYSDALMYAVFYEQDIDGFWREIQIAEGSLRDYCIDDDGQIIYRNKSLDSLKNDKMTAFENSMQVERTRREEEKRFRAEEQQRLFEEAERKRQEEQKKREEDEKERRQRLEEEQQRIARKEAEGLAEIKRREEAFIRKREADFLQQEIPIWDDSGNRWIKCEFCGVIAKESKFALYGGINHVNLGTCKNCSLTRAQGGMTMTVQRKDDSGSKQNGYDPLICPECGGKLREKIGPYGNFMGCSNYPNCRFTRKIPVRRTSKNIHK